MSEFYRLRKENPQLTKAAALQIAQQKMIAGKLTLSNAKNQRRDTSEVDIAPLDYSHPYFWSPFILIGNWR
jgi:CHAT domain-containing protein